MSENIMNRGCINNAKEQEIQNVSQPQPEVPPEPEITPDIFIAQISEEWNLIPIQKREKLLKNFMLKFLAYQVIEASK